MNYVTDKDLFERLKTILSTGTYHFDEYGGLRGTGSSGLLLEELLGFDPSNKDGPDSGRWEVKFHSGKSPLTLFHKTPEPDGVMRSLLNEFGWVGKSGHINFRHTIWGTSPRGFTVQNSDGNIVVSNSNGIVIEPFWKQDTVVNAFAYKLRRLIVVHGKVSRVKRAVTFEYALLHEEPHISQIVDAVVSGKIAIDFDLRATETNALRDHGTKFRISISDLSSIYKKSSSFGTNLQR